MLHSIKDYNQRLGMLRSNNKFDQSVYNSTNSFSFRFKLKLSSIKLWFKKKCSGDKSSEYRSAKEEHSNLKQKIASTRFRHYEEIMQRQENPAIKAFNNLGFFSAFFNTSHAQKVTRDMQQSLADQNFHDSAQNDLLCSKTIYGSNSAL